MSSQRAAFNILDHLEYVRVRLIRAAVAFVICSIVAYFFARRIIPYLLYEEAGLTGLIYLGPMEAFFSELKIALALGLIISLPFILYQLWALFTPAMTKQQRVTTLILLPAAYILFIGGCAFGLLYVLPLALQFFLSFGGDALHQEIAIGNYVNFLISFVLPFGVIFELPVLVVMGARIGVLKPKKLAKNRKYVIFGVFVVATLVTPADPVSQIALAIPLLILFELSLILARWTAPKDAPDGESDESEGPNESSDADSTEPSEV